MSLRLSHIYWLIFPEDKELSLWVHTADADVTMLSRLTLTYLWRALGVPLPGKFEAFTTLGSTLVSNKSRKGWRMSETEMSEQAQRLKVVAEDEAHKAPTSVKEDTSDEEDADRDRDDWVSEDEGDWDKEEEEEEDCEEDEDKNEWAAEVEAERDSEVEGEQLSDEEKDDCSGTEDERDSKAGGK